MMGKKQFIQVLKGTYCEVVVINSPFTTLLKKNGLSQPHLKVCTGDCEFIVMTNLYDVFPR